MEIEPTMRDILAGLPETLEEFLERPDSLRPAVLRKYVERVEEIRDQDPRMALRLGEAGYRHAAKMPRFVPKRERRQVLADAYGVYGGAARTLALFDRAQVAYTIAWELVRPVARPEDRVKLLGRVAFLRRDERRFDEAWKTAEEEVSIARAAGDERWLPRALVDLAKVLTTMGKLEEGIRTNREALGMLDPQSEPAYYFAAVQSLTLALTKTEDAEPEELMLAIEHLENITAAEPESSLKRFHVLWAKGLAFRKVGNTEAATSCFVELRAGFVRHDLPTYAAAVTMEEALIYFDQGDTDKTREIAKSLFPFFKWLRVDREASPPSQGS